MIDTREIGMFWGKARPASQSDVTFHPAILHCVDVAAVSMILIEKNIDFEIKELAGAIPFLVALHDIGKFTRVFQQKCEELWPSETFGTYRPVAGPRHDTAGYHLLRHHCAKILDEVFSDTTDRVRAPLICAIAGHHGQPPKEADNPNDRFPPGICPDSARVAGEVAAILKQLFRPPTLPPFDIAAARRWSWRLAGITTLADWIGSGPEFPYVGRDAVLDLSAYLELHALPRARRAVAASGVIPAAPRGFSGLTGLFPYITRPSPSQSWVEQVFLPEGPVLALIEDVTGSGKTEAAITLAHRLIASGRARGLFIALPTMATAGAMFARMRESYRALFDAEAKPSLALAHGRALLDTRFSETILAASSPDDLSDDAPSASSQCAAWLADGGRRALLAQVGVGTLDQALLAVLPARHAALRQLGLSSKVLVIDEVHAYDAYMRTELCALLRMHAAGGGSAVLLSATLTRDLKKKLLAAFAEGCGAAAPQPGSAAYPLATLVAPAGVIEQACAMRDNTARRVAVRRLDDAQAAVATIAAAAARGAAVAWIRNTVDDAIAGHMSLQAAGVDAALFHARFAMSDRLRIEQSVLARYGRAAKARAGVVVATQVLEQSLDLDFDLVVTDIAPADLLVQRAGRLWRHERGERPLGVAELCVVCPEPVADPAADWLASVLRGTAAIYPTPLIWRSARAVFGAGEIDSPGNIRALVEAAYDKATPVPPKLERADNELEAGIYTATAEAKMNVLAADAGYTWRAGAWDADTRTPTRLEDEPQVTLRLARRAPDGRVVPWAEAAESEIAWALSEVRVAARLVADAPVSAGDAEAGRVARASWGRWARDADEVKLVVLLERDGVYTADRLGANGKPGQIIYSKVNGLKFE